MLYFKNMFEWFFAPMFLLFSILISGFFLWIGLKIIGKDRGILEAGIANFAAGIFAIIVGSILTIIPLMVLIYPLIIYLLYLYALKLLLKISMVEAFLVSILASIVFILLSFVFAFFAGIWLIKFVPFGFSPMPRFHF
jgi:hypothetical protein